MNKEQIIEAIESMTVLELSELVKALEEKFGVSAAAPVAVAAAPVAEAAALSLNQLDIKRLLQNTIGEYKIYAYENKGYCAAISSINDYFKFNMKIKIKLTGNL